MRQELALKLQNRNWKKKSACVKWRKCWLTPPVTHATCLPKIWRSSTKDIDRNGFMSQCINRSDRTAQNWTWARILILCPAPLLGSALVLLAFSGIQSCLLVVLGKPFAWVAFGAQGLKAICKPLICTFPWWLSSFPSSRKYSIGFLKLACLCSPPFWQRKGEKYWNGTKILINIQLWDLILLALSQRAEWDGETEYTGTSPKHSSNTIQNPPGSHVNERNYSEGNCQLLSGKSVSWGCFC